MSPGKDKVPVSAGPRTWGGPARVQAPPTQGGSKRESEAPQFAPLLERQSLR